MRVSVATLVLLVLAGVASAASPQAATFRVVVSGAGHRPVAGDDWQYVVKAVDSSGKPVSGTAIVRVFVGDKAVDTVGWFGFKGTLRGTYRWSPQLLGSRATFRVKVVGPGGSRFAAYKVLVVANWPTVTGSPTFRSTVSAQTHTPVARTPWRYIVRAVNTNGKRFSGTAIVRTFANRRVMDTVGWFGFKGNLRGSYRWPSKLRHTLALFQVKVIGPGGTRAMSYRVRVR